MSAAPFETDAVVIGAGVIGLACARALALRGLGVIVLEKETAIGTGVSARNSEVIHASLYDPVGSLKQSLCATGRRLLYPYLEKAGVAHRKLGKLVVATDPIESEAIETIYLNALRNGVEALQFLTGAQARALEPGLRAHAAILSPESGILDAHGYMLALRGDFESAGGAIAFSTPCLGVDRTADGRLDVRSPDATLRARIVINAGGLFAAQIARSMTFFDAARIPTMHFAKGSYFACAGRSPFSRLIYPAPVDGGLGVHATLDLQGGLRFGPDVEWLSEKDPGALNYAIDPVRGDAFYQAVRKYWPGLRDEALTPAFAGIRPKLASTGRRADFKIDGPTAHGVEGLVQMFGIESPGLTSSLAIAEHVARLALNEDVAAATPRKGAVLFDRDGTLNDNGDGYTHRLEDLRWIDGAIDAVRAVNRAGLLAIVVTNQSGVARGYYDEAAMRRLHDHMQSVLAQHGAHIDAFYHCPYHDAAATDELELALGLAKRLVTTRRHNGLVRGPQHARDVGHEPEHRLGSVGSEQGVEDRDRSRHRPNAT